MLVITLNLPRLLSGRLPFFYGWVILACLCCAGFSRQGPAVATLSVFVEPLTREFGWSRTALSGAVSLGGLLAALSSPLIGPILDRGSRIALCLAVLVTGTAMILLSLTQSLLFFYLLARTSASSCQAVSPSSFTNSAVITPTEWSSPAGCITRGIEEAGYGTMCSGCQSTS